MRVTVEVDLELERRKLNPGSWAMVEAVLQGCVEQALRKAGVQRTSEVLVEVEEEGPATSGHSPAGELEGRRILAVRPMTEEEAVEEGWHTWMGHRAPVLELDDGSIWWPARNPGKSAPGVLAGRDRHGDPQCHYGTEGEL